jgi:DNA polymerase I
MRTCVADLEGNGLRPEVSTVWCGVFIDVRTEEVFKFRPTEIKDMLKFMDTCTTLVFHNGFGYDFPVLKDLYNYEYKGKKVDSLLMSRLLYPDRVSPKGVKDGPHSVESWGATFGRRKPEHEDWSVFSEDMLHRCTEDCWIQLQLYRKCVKDMVKTGWPPSAMKLTFKLFEILQKQEDNGWPVNRNAIIKSVKMLDNWISRIDKVITPHLPDVLENPYNVPVSKPFKQDKTLTIAAKKWFTTEEEQREISGPFTRVIFRKTNLDSNDELKNFLLSLGWQPKEWNYKKDPLSKRILKDSNGLPIVSSPKLKHDDPFLGIDGKLGRLAAKRVQSRSRRSILEGWLSNIRPDETISQRITGIASTGRLTHSGIVNVPGVESFFGRQMRKVFIAKDPFVLVGTDAAGCQDRMLLGRATAYGVKDPVFEDMLLNGSKEKGTDSHTRARDALNAVFKKTNTPLITRRAAKNFNYGYKFNAGNGKLGSMAKGDAKLGEKIREALDSVFTAQVKVQEILVEEWRSNAEQRLNQWGKVEWVNGWFKGLDGRPIRVKLEKDVLVYALQSDEAILMQYALCFLYKWLCDRKWVYGKDYMFVANIHDEYQALVHKDKVKDYRVLADKSIKFAGEYLNIQCPHIGESDEGQNWAETH